MDISVIIPCLNEKQTIEKVIFRAKKLIALVGTGEIIVVDNGSSDGSDIYAEKSGAKVLHVKKKGYGSALREGILNAQGEIIIMADADDTYHLDEALPLITTLKEGADVVIGNRLIAEKISGAMTRWSAIGTPIISFFGKVFFGTSIGDYNCGMRVAYRSSLQKLNLVANGMEFASEMIIKAQLQRFQIREVPVTLYHGPYGRVPHLRPLQDGWRHIRFMLWHAPRWLFLFPGWSMVTIGLIAVITTLRSPVAIGVATFDVMTSIAGMVLVIVGTSVIGAGSLARAYGYKAGFLEKEKELFPHDWWVCIGGLMSLLSLCVIVILVANWVRSGFIGLNIRNTLRILIPSCLACAVGIQLFFYGFLRGVFSIPVNESFDKKN